MLDSCRDPDQARLRIDHTVARRMRLAGKDEPLGPICLGQRVLDLHLYPARDQPRLALTADAAATFERDADARLLGHLEQRLIRGLLRVDPRPLEAEARNHPIWQLFDR